MSFYCVRTLKDGSEDEFEDLYIYFKLQIKYSVLILFNIFVTKRFSEVSIGIKNWETGSVL